MVDAFDVWPNYYQAPWFWAYYTVRASRTFQNDNCHVEQKNFTHVREFFGYERYNREELIKYMNEIYIDY